MRPVPPPVRRWIFSLPSRHHPFRGHRALPGPHGTAPVARERRCFGTRSDPGKKRRPSRRASDRGRPKLPPKQGSPPQRRRHRNHRSRSEGFEAGEAAATETTTKPTAAAQVETSSVASSIVDRWEEDRTIRGKGNDYNAGPRRSAARNTFQIDRFRDRQQEYCEVVDAYRRFWYRDANHDSPADWRTAMAFEHPGADEDLPWLEVSWERILASEDLFRKVCASHHNLFLACASCLTEHTESQKNQGSDRGSGSDRGRRKQGPEGTTTVLGSSGDDWSENDLFRADCEELLRTILPRWESLRRERTALVDRYRPPGDGPPPLLPGEGLSPTGASTLEDPHRQQVSPWATAGDCDNNNDDDDDREAPPAAPAPSERARDGAGEDPPGGNRWVGWLKHMIAGDEGGGGAETAETVHPRTATAHSDPECAPNHYHYSKIIGQLYFHYLPHERHIRGNPFHLYTKTEREEGTATPMGNDENDCEVEVGLGRDSIGANARAKSASDDAGDPTGGSPRRVSYQSALLAYEKRRREILRERAATMQSVVDHALLPLAPAPPSRNTATTTQLQEDDSNRVLTDKIVRLLIRSYLDQEELGAAQQAERVYHRHPNHRKKLLWYVAMSYLRVIKSMRKHPKGSPSRDPSPRTDADDPAVAAKRICELVSSKYAKEAREFQHCSAIAFEALAILPEQSRHKLNGYYDRVHSLGILKFGPKVWEALIDGNGEPPGPAKDGSLRGRKQSGSLRSPSPASAETPEESTPLVVDLSQSLNSNDHKILHHLIQIYSKDEKYFPRALRLLDLLLELYPAYDLQESLTRATFHKLLGRLSKQREKAWEKQKASQNPSRSTDSDGCSRELESAFRILDKMISHEWWFPNEDTFRILFPLAAFSDNPAPGTERVLARLEACSFLSVLSPPKPRATLSASQQTARPGPSVSTSNRPFGSLEASSHALTAWMNTASYNNYAVPPGHPHPAERAWAILQTLRTGSSEALLLDGADPASGHRHGFRRSPGPTDALYTLALKVCSRIMDSPHSLEVAMDIFEAAAEDKMLLEGDICRVLLGVIMNFSSSDSDNLRRVEAAKRVHQALVELDPDYGAAKPAVLGFLKKQTSYIRIRHPELYENHLAELKLLEPEVSSPV